MVAAVSGLYWNITANIDKLLGFRDCDSSLYIVCFSTVDRLSGCAVISSLSNIQTNIPQFLKHFNVFILYLRFSVQEKKTLAFLHNIRHTHIFNINRIITVN